MDDSIREKIITNAEAYLRQGYHCSEGILKAVGEHSFPDALPDLIKTAAPFCGGVSGTQEELCGAFTGGLIVIGALYGRTSPEENDDECLQLAAAFRSAFIAHFGYLRCKDLRAHWVGKPRQPDCAELTAQTAALLLDVIEK